MKVLIADSSVVLRERLVSMLSELAGVDMVGEAQDAPQTLEAIRTLKPDVVILDTHMRGGSGIEVLKHSRVDQPSTVFVILTSQSYQQYRRKYLESGAHFFFSKSTELKLLVGTIKDLVMHSERESS